MSYTILDQCADKMLARARALADLDRIRRGIQPDETILAFAGRVADEISSMAPRHRDPLYRYSEYRTLFNEAEQVYLEKRGDRHE